MIVTLLIVNNGEFILIIKILASKMVSLVPYDLK